MEHARPPAELVLEGGPASRADAWRKWLKQFKVFLKASGVCKEGKDTQASLLINLIGADGYDIYSTFKFLKEEEKNGEDIDVLIKRFDEHFGTKQNTTMARFRFFTRNQLDGENIDAYVTALRLLSQHCEFEHLEDGLIRDRVVCGVLDTAVRDRLLRTDDLTLEKAVKICQANEVSTEENKQLEIAKITERRGKIDLLSSSRAPRRGDGRAGEGPRATGGRGGGGGGSRASYPPYSGSSSGGAIYKQCCACGAMHGEGKCPARLAKCFLCHNKGHFKKMCPYKNSKHVYELQDLHKSSDECDDDDLFYISTLDGNVYQQKDSKWHEKLTLTKNGMCEIFKLDTGSDLNVLSLKVFQQLGYTTKDINLCTIKAQSFCGNYVPIVGTCQMMWTYKQEPFLIDFVISSANCPSVLGKYTCEKLGVIKRIYSVNLEKYKDLFHGVGKLPGKYKIQLENNASPSVCPVRKIPIGVRDKLKHELDNMVEMGIIRKVSHPTAWVNGIVLPAKKDGSLRVCLDPRPLNKAVRRAHYPLPTLTDIATKLSGAKYFSKLDARSGFWMIELDDESADLCTFGTPFGRYQFLRLPYGINCASEVFHGKVRQLLEDLEGVDSFVDDIIVYGKTKDEHDARLTKLLDRAQKVGIKFNKEKCQFCVEQVSYLGHTFSSNGMQIDTVKLKAISEMPSPKDKPSLERFLGMINYLSKFISNYSELATPLRELLKKGNEWVWQDAHEEAVRRLKEAVCRAPVLALYAAERPVLVTVDASAGAVGAALMQDGRPVEYASMTLSDTQRRYAQIEKEMLAIVFALERFHQYVYGRSDVTVETDHKPLEAIFKKALDAVPARLQRMMLRIQCYDFNVVYKPGKFMFVADTLSRAALPEVMNDKVTTELEDQSCFLIEYLPFSDSKLQSIREATKNDPECQNLIYYVLNGWPKYKKDVNEVVQVYWSYRGDFEFIDGIIFKDNLVFIPQALRGDMIKRVHEGHLGIDRCKRRARDVMFWSGMSSDVERCVRACAACAEHAARPPREPMIPHAVPDLPWRKLGADIFTCRQKSFLLIVDYFSNFIEVCPIQNIGTRSVVVAMKDQFARHGIPAELITDNGPAFASGEFKKFTKEWCFQHTTSSPNYPQSNGLSERAVRTVKAIIVKSLSSGSDIYMGLLNFRSTPRYGISSPSQLLMGRRLNTTLPVSIYRLYPDRNNSSDYAGIIKNKDASKRSYDNHSRALPPLRAGDEVLVADGARRRRMRVEAPANTPRSYFLRDVHGRQYRRNRRHILKAPEMETPELRESSPSLSEKENDDGNDDEDVADEASCEAESSQEIDNGDQPSQSEVSLSPNSIYNTFLPPRSAALMARDKLASFFNKK